MSKNTKKKTINKAKILNNYVEIKLIERKQKKTKTLKFFCLGTGMYENPSRLSSCTLHLIKTYIKQNKKKKSNSKERKTYNKFVLKKNNTRNQNK